MALLPEYTSVVIRDRPLGVPPLVSAARRVQYDGEALLAYRRRRVSRTVRYSVQEPR